jgi:hypothetical protein
VKVNRVLQVRDSPGAKCKSQNKIEGGVENTGIDLLSRLLKKNK